MQLCSVSFLQEWLGCYCLCLSSVSEWPAVSYQCLSYFELFRYTRRLVHIQCKLLWIGIRLSKTFWAEWRWTYDLHPDDQGLCDQPFPDDKHTLTSKVKHQSLQSQRNIIVRVKMGLWVFVSGDSLQGLNSAFCQDWRWLSELGSLLALYSVLPGAGRLASSSFYPLIFR